MDPHSILVTGATDGIGKQTAMDLARMGERVLVHGRSRPRGEAVLDEIRRATGSDALDLFVADFASPQQVRRLAAEVREKVDRLDVLINNAGVYMGRRQVTEAGLELTFQVNYLAPFLLTNLLLDLLKASAPARIVNVSSTLHQGARLDFANLQGERHFDGHEAYAVSKLGNVLFTVELAERLAGTGVTVNALHPGGISTKLLHAGYGGGGSPVEVGAERVIYVAAAPELDGVTGKYFTNNRVTQPSSLAGDARLRRELWQVSEKLAGLA